MGVFANALTVAVARTTSADHAQRSRGLGAWLLRRLQRREVAEPRLKVLERVRLTPRQALVLIEAEGEKFVVVTSESAAPVLVPLKVARSKSTARKRMKAPETRNP